MPDNGPRLSKLKENRERIRRAAEGLCLEVRSAGREQFTAGEEQRLAAMRNDLAELDDLIEQRQADADHEAAAYAGLDERFGHLRGRGGGTGGREVRGGPRSPTGATVCPIDPPVEELRRMLDQVRRGLPATYEHRFTSADSLLPPELYPVPIGRIHPTRILDRLPSYAITQPSVEFVRHVSTTGAPGTVAEGAVKPSVTLVVDKLVAAAVKVAATITLTREILDDWNAFQQYALTELQRQVIDAEGLQLLTGDGTGTNMTGFYATSGILTHDASADTGGTVWDTFERCIAQLRTGSALAEPDLLVLNPLDWSAARRVKDNYGRYIVSADPSSDEVDTAWGIDVVPSVQNPVGQGLFIDTTKFGQVAIRSALGMFMGFINDDFARNQISWAAEERLVLTVTRPAAVLAVTKLPAPTAADVADTKSGKK